MEERLSEAVRNDKVEGVEEILRENPNLNVDMRDGSGYTALYIACARGLDPIVSILLARRAIDVNLKDFLGFTPFMRACDNGRTSSVRLLLKDPRVLVNERDVDGETALLYAACYGLLDIIRWWIVSGREMDLGEAGDGRADAIKAAKKSGETAVVALLERFKKNPAETRHAMRVGLGLIDELAAEMFAMVVFVSDGLMQVRATTTTTPAARYFSIATQLPLELQMVLCYRVAGVPKEIIPAMERETAFTNLAKRI